MFSTQQLKLRSLVSEFRSMLPEFDEEDRPDVLEHIQSLVSQYEYTFPEEIWMLIKSYLFGTGDYWDTWIFKSKFYVRPSLPITRMDKLSFRPKEIIRYYQNGKCLTLMRRNDFSLDNNFGFFIENKAYQFVRFEKKGMKVVPINFFKKEEDYDVNCVVPDKRRKFTKETEKFHYTLDLKRLYYGHPFWVEDADEKDLILFTNKMVKDYLDSEKLYKFDIFEPVYRTLTYWDILE